MSFKTLRTGYQFSQLWPKNEPYVAMFQQTKAVKLSLLSMTVMPSLAIVTAFLQIQYFGLSQINLTLAMTLLFLSIPVHAFYWLGNNAKSTLPSTLRAWYRELEAKSKKDGVDYNHPIISVPKNVRKTKADHKLTFLDLALLLNDVFKPATYNKK